MCDTKNHRTTLIRIPTLLMQLVEELKKGENTASYNQIFADKNTALKKLGPVPHPPPPACIYVYWSRSRHVAGMV